MKRERERDEERLKKRKCERDKRLWKRQCKRVREYERGESTIKGMRDRHNPSFGAWTALGVPVEGYPFSVSLSSPYIIHQHVLSQGGFLELLCRPNVEQHFTAF